MLRFLCGWAIEALPFRAKLRWRPMGWVLGAPALLRSAALSFRHVEPSPFWVQRGRRGNPERERSYKAYAAIWGEEPDQREGYLDKDR